MARRWFPRVGGLTLILALLGAGVPENPFDHPQGPGRGASDQRACGCSHSCGTATYQGCGCGAVACFPGGSHLTSLAAGPAALRAAVELAGPAPCVNGLAAEAFPCHGVELESYVGLEQMRTGATSGSNLWGFADLADGREYAVVGLSNGTAVVEVTDPVHPRVVGSVAGPESLWREVKVYQVREAGGGRRAWAYVVSEAPTAGLQILDLSRLPDAVGLATTFRAFDTSHTVTLSNVDLSTGAAPADGPAPVLYVQGARHPTVGVFALDVSNPAAPSVLGRYLGSYGHDTWTGRFSGERAHACLPGHDPCDVVVVWTGSDIRVLDWTDKPSPAILAEISYPELGFAHSGWISRDRNYLFSTDELDERETGRNSRIRVFDVRDWRHPFLAAEWDGSTRAIEHNGYAVGDRYVVSNYERGLTILAVSNPLAPVEEAFFDTFPEDDSPEYHGSWGVYPYLPSGTILLSNIDGAAGLFLLKATPANGDNPRDPIVLPPHRPRVPHR